MPGKNGAASKSASRKSSSPGRSGKTTVVVRKTPAASKSTGASANGSGNHKSDLEEILRNGLKDIYWAEKHLVKALAKMAKSADNEQLRKAFLTHQEQTQNQVDKLNSVFELMGIKPQGKKCAAMEGLIEEGNEQVEEYEKGPARDAALIMAAQKVEHYEIASYGTLRTFASLLGLEDGAKTFDEILTEEADTDKLLTGLAFSINKEALESSAEAED